MKHLLLCLMLLVRPAMAESVVYIPGLGDGPGSFRALARAVGGPAFNEAFPAHVPGQEDGRLTPKELAQDLRARLRGAGHAPPYLLVAHSLGGGTALAFAADYPSEVKALILIDPRLPGFAKACRNAGLKACEIPGVLRALMPPRDRAMIAGNDDLRLDRAPLGAVPVTVFGATRPGPGLSAAWQRLWLDHLGRFAAQLPAGQMIAVPGAGHYIHKQYPELIAQAIRAQR